MQNISHELIHILEHTLEDNLIVIPFLFLTYLVMEWLEHRTGDRANIMIRKAGRFGPGVGAIVGIFPQCGFSAAASNLYAGRVITVGTLVAIFLSTSDEMLPIMISEKVEINLIIRILVIKIIVGMIAGFVIDYLLRGKEQKEHHIHEMCDHDHCHCEKGIFRSALIHTIKIGLFILLISFVLDIIMHTVGEDAIGNLVLNQPFLGQMLAGIIGFIPNCASSVVLTELYLAGAMSFGALMSGLLVGSGIGILILFRVNHNKKENFKIMGIIYGIGVVVGFFLELLF